MIMLLKVGTTSPKLMYVHKRTWKLKKGHIFLMREYEPTSHYQRAILDDFNDNTIFVHYL